MNNIKNAFTFAELMVSLVIISVITALLYPTIAELAPNNNKQLFKSAYKTIEMTVSDIIDSQEGELISSDGAIGNTTWLCKEFESRLNTVAATDKDGNNINCNSNPAQLSTSNGMRWVFSNYADPAYTIFVDVNASNNKIASQASSAAELANCPNNWTAKIDGTDKAAGCFRTGNPISHDTFKINIYKNGKVDVPDTVGAQHLKEETQD